MQGLLHCTAHCLHQKRHNQLPDALQFGKCFPIPTQWLILGRRGQVSGIVPAGRCKCRLLGRTKEVKVPTGLPMEMESAVAQAPRRTTPKRCLRPSVLLCGVGAGTYAIGSAPLEKSPGCCWRLNHQQPHRCNHDRKTLAKGLPAHATSRKRTKSEGAR